MRKGLASTCKWKQWRGRGMRAVASATRVAAVRAQHRRRASAGTGQALPGAGAPPPAAQSIPRRPAKSALSLGNTNLWRVQLKEVLLVPALLLGKLNLAQVVEFPRLESSRPRRGQGNSRPVRGMARVTWQQAATSEKASCRRQGEARTFCPAYYAPTWAAPPQPGPPQPAWLRQWP